MPKGFSEREKQLIGQRLLEEGQRQFATYGLKKTNIEELTQAIGISKGAFYLFYDSKEALFMDVIEEIERRFRQQVLAAIETPAPTPRARLLGVLNKAFHTWKHYPLLQSFTSSEYEVLARRVPPEKVQEHLQSDRAFVSELVTRCQQSGIPIRLEPERLGELLYALFYASLHERDLGQASTPTATDVLIELVAAYSLGEIQLQTQEVILLESDKTK